MCRAQTPPSRVRSIMSIHKETSHTDLCAEKQEPHGAPLTHTDLLKPLNAERKETMQKTIREPVRKVLILPKISIDEVKQARKDPAAEVNGDPQNLKRKITVPQKLRTPAPKQKRITPRKLTDECERSMNLQGEGTKEEEHSKLIARLALAKLKEMLKDERKAEQKLRKLTERMLEHNDILGESVSDQDSVVVISSCIKWFE